MKTTLQLPKMSPQRKGKFANKFSPIREYPINMDMQENGPSTPIKINKTKFVPQTAKYEICSNGSPVRNVKRHPSNESFDKLLRAPMKANFQGVQIESSLFIQNK